MTLQYKVSWDRFEAEMAEIQFLNPDQAPHGIAALAAADCEFEYDPDAIDECGPAVFGLVTGVTELDEDALWDWLDNIIEPFSGETLELGRVRLTEARRAQSAL